MLPLNELSSPTEIHAYISGRVQGVNFRYHIRHKANELKLSGYARNLDDGRVEILAQGSQIDLYNLIDYIGSNPGLSYVTGIDINWQKPRESFNSFHIRF